jgi:hypothetical protein
VYGSAIGSASNTNGTSVTINGGVVTATSTRGDAIGGSDVDKLALNGGNITANGGTVKDSDGYGIRGIISTSDPGNAFVNATGDPGADANGIAPNDKTNISSGIFIADNVGQLYGSSVTLTQDATIGRGQTVDIPSGSTLVLGEDVVLTINGTLKNAGSIVKLSGSRIDGDVTTVTDKNGNAIGTVGTAINTAVVEISPQPATGHQTSESVATSKDTASYDLKGGLDWFEVNDVGQQVKNAGASFSGSTKYGVYFTLQAKEGCNFTKDTYVYVPGSSSAKITSVEDNGELENSMEITVFVTFPETTNKNLTGISIKTYPTKLDYLGEDKTFDPAGLVLDLTYDSGTGTAEYTDSTKGKFSFEPATLTTDTTEVTVFYGGLSTKISVDASNAKHVLMTSARYLDADGNTQVCANSTAVTGTETTLGKAGLETWYVLTDDLTDTSRITVLGDVHLILTDGHTLNVPKGLNVPEGSSLTIYSGVATTKENEQNGYAIAGTGALVAGTSIQASGDYNAGIGGNMNQNSGDVTVNGGVVESSGGGGSLLLAI